MRIPSKEIGMSVLDDFAGVLIGKGDYDAWGRFVFGSIAIGIITLPIWIVPYSVWYLAIGRKEDAEMHQRYKEARKAAQNTPRKLKPPITFSSLTKKKEWMNKLK